MLVKKWSLKKYHQLILKLPWKYMRFFEDELITMIVQTQKLNMHISEDVNNILPTILDPNDWINTNIFIFDFFLEFVRFVVFSSISPFFLQNLRFYQIFEIYTPKFFFPKLLVIFLIGTNFAKKRGKLRKIPWTRTNHKKNEILPGNGSSKKPDAPWYCWWQQ